MLKGKKDACINVAVIIMIGTVFSKILGFVRELSVAYKFGTSEISDAFLLTNSVPALIFSAFAMAIGINFIPIYQGIAGKEEKNKFTSNLFNISIAILLAGCVLVNIIPKYVLLIFASGLAEDVWYYALPMLKIVVFSIIPIIASTIFQSFSQANGLFYMTAFYGVMTNLVIIIFTLFSDEKKYYLLSIGEVAANTLGFFLFVFEAAKCGYHYEAIWNINDDNIKKMVVLTIPLLAENISSNLSLLVDKNVASYLDKGSISGLNYAGTLGNIAGTMIASPIITATFPVLSKLIANDNRKGFDEEFRKYSKIIIFLLCPISMAMLFYSKEIVVLIFEHGAFKSSSSQIVWQSMACYAIGIVPFGMQSYLIRGYYALQDTKTPVKIKVFALISNIVLNLVFIKRWRHMGIATSTSISYIIAFILLELQMQRKYNMIYIKRINKEILKGTILSALAGAISFYIFNFGILIDSLFLKLFFEILIFIIVYAIIFIMLSEKKYFNNKNILK